MRDTDHLRESMFAMADEIDRLRAENEHLTQSLAKIADWGGAWGPFPEKNAGWQAMAIVTAREAVKNPYNEGEGD